MKGFRFVKIESRSSMNNYSEFCILMKMNFCLCFCTSIRSIIIRITIIISGEEMGERCGNTACRRKRDSYSDISLLASRWPINSKIWNEEALEHFQQGNYIYMYLFNLKDVNQFLQIVEKNRLKFWTEKCL